MVRSWVVQLESQKLPVARWIGAFSLVVLMKVLLYVAVVQALPLNQTSHVLIISDVQLKNPAIAPSWMFSFFASLRHLIFKLYLKKSWRVAMRLKPDHVIFLGDMTASGRHVASDEE
jgi:hypothetical protein